MLPIFQKFSKSTQDSPRSNTVKPHFDKQLFSVTTSLGTVNLFSLALPMFLESVLNTSLGTINTAVLSAYSEEAVAATGSVSLLINLFSLLFSVIAIGSTVVISNHIGGERLERAAKIGTVAWLFCVSSGLLLGGLLWIFADPTVRLMNLEGTVHTQAVQYFRIRMAALFLAAGSSSALALLRCYGHIRSTVVVGVVCNVCNLAISIYVVHFATWQPILGVTGIALAAAISQAVSFAIAMICFFRASIPVKLPIVREMPRLLWDILKIGLPTGLSSCSFTLSQVITGSFIAVLGATAISAKVYYTTILSYAYLFSVNIGNANALLIGRLCGSGRNEHAKALNRQVVKITVAVNLLISLSILLLRVPLLSLFTTDPWILSVAFGVFLVDIITEQARAVSHVYEYALRAAGDVSFTVKVVLISCWLFGVGLAYILSIPLGWGLIGCWIGLALDETVRAVATFYRWRTDKWIYFHTAKEES